MEHKKEEFFKAVAGKTTAKQNSHHAAAANGVRGQPKKGGAGGKGTWGKGGVDDLTPTSSALDQNDPNYASDDDGDVVVRVTEMVSPQQVILQEYASSGDAEELARSLRELSTPAQFPQFVYHSLLFATERQAFERELVSQLLLALTTNHTLTQETMEAGFQIALDRLDDTVLDNPDAVDTLARFLARAVVDEILPPAFVDKRASSATKLADESLALAHGLINEPHRIDRIRHIWGPGTFHSVKRMKEEVTTLLEEYLVNGDVAEADKCVRNLHAPSFHFQLVREAIRLATTKMDGDRAKLGSLLAALAKEGLLSAEAMKHGFDSISLADLCLDVPKAKEHVSALVERAKTEGWLPADYTIVSA